MNLFKRIFFIVEGYSEADFCANVLADYFATKCNVFCDYLIIGKSVNKDSLLGYINKSLKENKDSIITTMIDYYGLKNLSDFPGYEPSNNALKNVKSMECELLKCFDNNYHWRLVPYFQLHEFEALLFADVLAFCDIPRVSEKEINQLENILSQFKCPESINSNIPPSRRIKNVISHYNKITHGIVILKKIAERNGFDYFRNKCNHFNEWISQLENKINCV